MITVSFRAIEVVGLAGLLLAVLDGTPPVPTPATGEPGPVVLVFGQSNALHPEIAPAIVDRLHELGVDGAQVLTQATGGQPLEALLAYDLPRLVERAHAVPRPPTALVLVHGEAHAQTRETALAYLDATFGAHPDSLVSQIRTQWPDLPILVAEVRATDPVWGLGLDELRAVQHWGCMHTPRCAVLETGAVELRADRLHYSPDGAATFGREVADTGRARGLW